MTMNGIDISKHQAGLDLSKIKCDFVIVKATEGIGYVDAYCDKFFQQGLKLKKKLGFYHFARPVNDAVQEARYFYNQTKNYFGKAIPFLDWEAENIGDTAWAKRWLDEVYRLSGVKPMIYTSESVVNAYNWSAVANAGYGLWVAKYRDKILDYNYDMSNAGAKPIVKYWPFYAMWQWTGTGRLTGYGGDLDCDIFYGDSKAWDKYVGKSKASTVTKKNTPDAFYNAFNGKIIDYDGAYGAQCVDAFKVCCDYLGIPVKPTPNNWANGYWLYRNQLGFDKYFDFITDKSKLRKGDWCIWNKGSSCPSTHIAMYWDKINNIQARFFGENQGGNGGFRLAVLQTDIMGALRPKAWATSSQSTPKPSNTLDKYTDEQLADKVLKGEYGTGEARKKALGNRYDAVQAIVNKKLATPKQTPIKVGDIVKVVKAINYDNGQPFRTYYKTYKVMELKGKRAVIGVNGVVVAPINVSYLKKA